MLRPSITVHETCLFHTGAPAHEEVRLEETTTSGTIIQYYAPMCATCVAAYDSDPGGMLKNYKRVMKFHKDKANLIWGKN